MAEKKVGIVIDIGAKGAKKAFGVINRGFDSVGKSVVGVGKHVVSLQGALAGLAVGAGLKELIGFMADTEAAAKKMQAGLGLSARRTKELEEAAKDLYNANLGESIGGNIDIITQAFRAMGDVGTEELSNVAWKAILFNETFGADTKEVIQTSQTLMKNFGLTSSQAFDFIAKGFKEGLNESGDFLDSIKEYSTQFKEGKFTAEQFFSAMQTGYTAGVLGTDKVADLFKEFRVRVQDGSKLTKESFELLGIKADEFSSKMARGSITTAQAFQIVIGKLRETKDQSTQMQAGVGLLGTMFEDLGNEAVLGIDLAKTKLSELEGSTDSIDSKFGLLNTTFQGLWRSFQDGITGALEAADAVGIINQKITELRNTGRLDEFFDDIGKAAVKAFALAIEYGGKVPRTFFQIESAVYETLSAVQSLLSAIVTLGQLTAVISSPIKATQAAVLGLDAAVPYLAELKASINELGEEYQVSAREADNNAAKYKWMADEAKNVAREIRKTGLESQKTTEEFKKMGDSSEAMKKISDQKPIEIKFDADTEYVKAKLSELADKKTVWNLIGGEWVEVPVKADDEQAKIDIANLTKTETKIIEIQTVEKKKTGGVAGFAGGYKLPGYGRQDVVPAMLTWGERVTNALSARVWDSTFPALMESMNRVSSANQAKALLAKFAGFSGGGVAVSLPTMARQKTSGYAAGGSVTPPNLGTLDLRFATRRGTITGDQSILKELQFELTRARMAAEI